LATGAIADIHIKIFLITAIIVLFVSVTVGMIIFMIIFKSNKNKTERLRVEYKRLEFDKLSFKYSVGQSSLRLGSNQ
jgi:flagellar basal body-associated protein FliL